MRWRVIEYGMKGWYILQTSSTSQNYLNDNAFGVRLINYFRINYGMNVFIQALTTMAT